VCNTGKKFITGFFTLGIIPVMNKKPVLCATPVQISTAPNKYAQPKPAQSSSSTGASIFFMGGLRSSNEDKI